MFSRMEIASGYYQRKFRIDESNCYFFIYIKKERTILYKD